MVRLANTTGNMGEDVIRVQTQCLYRHKKKLEFKYIDAAMFLRSIPKFGSVDGTGGVRIDRGLVESDLMRSVNYDGYWREPDDRIRNVGEGPARTVMRTNDRVMRL